MARRSNSRAPSKRTQTARRNVRLQTAPQRNAIDRAELSSSQDYLRAIQAAQSAYGGYQKELGNVPKFPLQNLTGQLQGQLGQFHEMLGGVPEGVPNELSPGFGGESFQAGLPQSETSAGTALYSQLGDNAFNTLTNTASRDTMYRKSGAREGALGERYAKENLLQDLQDQLEGYTERRLQLSDLQGPMIQQEMDRLADEAESRRSENALMEYLTGQINSDLRPNGPGNGPGNSPGNRLDSGLGPGPGGGTGGYGLGDTAAGGNQGAAGTSLSSMISQINQIPNFTTDIPLWLRQIITQNPEGGPGAWENVQQLSPRKRQIWRGTKQHLNRIYRQQEYGGLPPGTDLGEAGYENPFQWGGTG